MTATLDAPRRRRPRTGPPNRPPSSGPSDSARRSARGTEPFATLVADAEADLIRSWQHARRRRPDGALPLTELLLAANHSLIRSAVRRTRAWRLERRELEHAAVTGVLLALERFRPTAGGPFAPYARHWIRKELQRTLAAGDFPVAIPAHRTGKLAAAAALTATPIDDHDLAAALDVGVSTAAGLRKVLHVGNLADQPERLQPTSPDPAEEIAVHHAIQAALAGLEPRAAAIVRLRHGLDDGEPRSLREVARVLGISDFTVRTHLARAHSVLARHLR